MIASVNGRPVNSATSFTAELRKAAAVGWGHAAARRGADAVEIHFTFPD